MIIQTSSLADAALDWALSHVDQQCAGMRWEMRDGVMTGIASEGNDFLVAAGELCCFIPPKPGVISRIMTARRLGVPAYHPSSDPSAAMGLMVTFGVSVDDWQTPLWGAQFTTPKPCAHEKVSPSHCRQLGETPAQAVARCLVFQKFGETVDVPQELTRG